MITDEQQVEGRKIVEDNYEQFDVLRQQQRDAYWEFLQGGSQDQETLRTELERIDAEATAHAAKVRVVFKKLLSKEQMDQHLKEVADRQKAMQKKK